MSLKWLEIAKRIQAIAQTGLEYANDKFDIERYQMLRDISVEIMEELSDTPVEKIRKLFTDERGYQTPKIDIRAVVFRDNKLLMVQEKIDNGWTLPGGWADIGLSPFQIAKKETFEEAGLIVDPIRLLAVHNKSSHAHPPDKWEVYKFFILCKDMGGKISSGMETKDVMWMERNEKLSLSEPRILQSQLDLMFDFYDNPGKQVICD